MLLIRMIPKYIKFLKGMLFINSRRYGVNKRGLPVAPSYKPRSPLKRAPSLFSFLSETQVYRSNYKRPTNYSAVVKKCNLHRSLVNFLIECYGSHRFFSYVYFNLLSYLFAHFSF